MPTCPEGHDSASGDFCDVCGMKMDAPVAASVAVDGAAGGSAEPVASAGAVSTGAAQGRPAEEACPFCGTPSAGRFCEGCGFDFKTGTHSGATPHPGAGTAVPDEPEVHGDEPAEEPPTPAPPGTWTAVVGADRAYYETVIAEGGPDAADIDFPGYCPERQFTLAGESMQIGRRSVSRGLNPAIDLTGPPADPGISRLHAVLVARPEGGWSILDPGSENGTRLNGVAISTGEHVSLSDGDHINLGAWTVITIRAA